MRTTRPPAFRTVGLLAADLCGRRRYDWGDDRPWSNSKSACRRFAEIVGRTPSLVAPGGSCSRRPAAPTRQRWSGCSARRARVATGSAIVAHFDHRLRGEGAARRDLAAVEELCARFGLPLETGAWDAPVRGEAAAREARYRFLGDVARARAGDAVVTGHTLDDQVETVMLHTMRGAGPYGLAGMAADAPWPLGGGGSARAASAARRRARGDARVLRGARLRYVDDPTNDDLSILRNRVRAASCCRSSTRCRPMRAASSRRWRNARARASRRSSGRRRTRCWRHDDGVVRLSRPALREMTAELSPYAYRQALRALVGDAREFDRRHYALMAGAADAAHGIDVAAAARRRADRRSGRGAALARRTARRGDRRDASNIRCRSRATLGAWSIAIVESVRMATMRRRSSRRRAPSCAGGGRAIASSRAACAGTRSCRTTTSTARCRIASATPRRWSRAASTCCGRRSARRRMRRRGGYRGRRGIAHREGDRADAGEAREAIGRRAP